MIRAAFILIAMTAPATAHDWYTGAHDPRTGSRCCGGQDCAVLKIETGVIEAVSEGYRLRLSLEQAREINPNRHVSVDTVIPWNRVQPSPDGNWHVCLPPYPMPHMSADIYCFWEPPGT